MLLKLVTVLPASVKHSKKHKNKWNEPNERYEDITIEKKGIYNRNTEATAKKKQQIEFQPPKKLQDKICFTKLSFRSNLLWLNARIPKREKEPTFYANILFLTV